MKLTAREKRIKRLVESWQEDWKPGRASDRHIRLYGWIQRHACADAILRILEGSNTK